MARKDKEHTAYKDRFRFEFLSISDEFYDEIKKDSGENSSENSASRAAKLAAKWKNDPNKGNTGTQTLSVAFDIGDDGATASASGGVSKSQAAKFEKLQQQYNKTCLQYLEAHEQLQNLKRQLAAKDAQIEELTAAYKN